MKLHQNISAETATIDGLSAFTKLEIRNFQGRLIRTFVMITPSYTLDIENWMNGVYFITSCDQKKRETVKLLVSH